MFSKGFQCLHIFHMFASVFQSFPMFSYVFLGFHLFSTWWYPMDGTPWIKGAPWWYPMGGTPWMVPPWMVPHGSMVPHGWYPMGGTPWMVPHGWCPMDGAPWMVPNRPLYLWFLRLRVGGCHVHWFLASLNYWTATI